MNIAQRTLFYVILREKGIPNFSTEGQKVAQARVPVDFSEFFVVMKNANLHITRLLELKLTH